MALVPAAINKVSIITEKTEITKCNNCGKTGVPMVELHDGPDLFYECQPCFQIGKNPNQRRWDCINGRKHGGYAWKHRFKYQKCIIQLPRNTCGSLCICSINNGCGKYHTGGRWKHFWSHIFRRRIHNYKDECVVKDFSEQE